MVKKSKTIKYEVGTIRIKSKDLTPVEKTKSSWKKTNPDISNIKNVVEQYSHHNNLKLLLDTKDNQFLRGFLTPDKKMRGERIKILPNGEKLDKAFSLFAPHLTIHDEKSNEHWDVIFQNPNGQLAHLYSLEKKKKHSEQKYKKVEEFKKSLPTLKRNLIKALENNELIALPIYTLLKTYMRVGNENSFKNKKHKGLTTLEKRDVKLKNEKVHFTFIGKDGVPQHIEEKFPPYYTSNLSSKIKKLKDQDFIFTDELGHPLRDTHIENGFLKYCGKKYYPHIVRSHFATERAENFINRHKKIPPTKQEIKNLYDEIAEKLGHKKFDKKSHTWKISHTVTISHYINPQLVEKISLLVI